MIITSVDEIPKGKILVCTSIGGSPLHNGHTRLLADCKPAVLDDLERAGYTYHESMVKLLVLVNSDDFLLRKHGFSFQDENTRAELIDGYKWVDFTAIHYSDEQTVESALSYFKPNYFCKGGDRSSRDNLPKVELDICDKIACKILFGVGGSDKVSSSSDLIRRAVEHYRG